MDLNFDLMTLKSGEVITIQPEGDTNACTKFHGNPFIGIPKYLEIENLVPPYALCPALQCCVPDEFFLTFCCLKLCSFVA